MPSSDFDIKNKDRIRRGSGSELTVLKKQQPRLLFFIQADVTEAWYVINALERCM